MFTKLINIIKSTDKIERSGLVSMLLKPISMILSLIYTPLLLSYLGDERYGLWATVLSMVNWINYFDVGIGNGLRNVLTKDIANKDFEHAHKAVSTSYIVLTFISLFIFLIVLLGIFVLNWKSIFSTQIDIRAVLVITFFFICINFVLSLANIVLYALQYSERVALSGCLIQIINVIGLLAVARNNDNSLVFVAVLFGSSTLFVHVFNTIQIINKNKYLRPQILFFQKSYIKEIANTGIQFFVIQVMCLLMFTMDNLLLSHYWGPSTVTPFSIVNKVFNVAYSVFAAFLVPYWSGTTSAVAQKDINWIKTSLKKTLIVLLLYVLGNIYLCVFFKPLVALWIHQELLYDCRIILLMCVFYILFSVLTIECQFINGTGQLKVQSIMYIFLGLANIPFSIYLGVSLGLKAFGIRLATAILVLIADIVLGINLRNIINDLANDDSPKIMQ